MVQRRRKRDLEEAITTSPVLARESGYINKVSESLAIGRRYDSNTSLSDAS